MIRVAMILAAGEGRRMRPLTDDRPKALVEARGRPLIERAFDDLLNAGIEDAAVNLGAFGDALEAYLASRRPPPRLRLSDERVRRLDTGGGVKRALPLLGDPDELLIANCDSVRLKPDGAPARAGEALNAAWNPSRMDALLLVAPLNAARGDVPKGDFLIEPDGRLRRPRAGEAATRAFVGLSAIRAERLRAINRETFSLNAPWDDAAERGRLFGLEHHGPWIHAGVPDALAVIDALEVEEKG